MGPPFTSHFLYSSSHSLFFNAALTGVEMTKLKDGSTEREPITCFAATSSILERMQGLRDLHISIDLRWGEFKQLKNPGKFEPLENLIKHRVLDRLTIETCWSSPRRLLLHGCWEADLEGGTWKNCVTHDPVWRK